MKRKDELKSDIVSSIDETILERVAKKRMAFMFGGRRRRQKKIVWISSIAAAACFCILASTLLWQFLPIAPGASGKQVPVYQGMSISSEKQLVEAKTDDIATLEYATLSFDSWYADSSGIELLDNDGNNGNGNNGDNGNHFGQNKKPIDEIAKDSLVVEGTAEKIYYAQPNQDIYITVHVSNPDNFEILSFTLNGKVYSSYMFEDGSDMENLILKYNVGDVEGMVEYTIDAIKYVDGTEIKDVVMAGDKTVQCGVYSENQPTAEVMSEVIGINKLTFTAKVTDPLNLIAERGGKAVAILSNGEEMIAQTPLTVGEDNTVVFENLLTDTDYEYAIVAIYDSLNGDGIVPIVLYSQTIHTHGVVAFDSVTVTQSGVTFAYVWNDAFENKVLTSAALYKGKEKVQELALDATSVDGLLSNSAYSIVITYENKGKSETVTLDFTTQEKAVPTLSIKAGEVTQSSLAFDLAYTDTDSVGAISKIELLHGEDEPIVSENVDVRSFENLLSNNEYTVHVTVTYDLNDGTGEHSFTETLTKKTKAKALPTVKFSEMNATKHALTGRYDITDLDGVLLDKTVALYQGENVVATTTSEGELSFSDLCDYTDYTIKVTYTYDLNDGKGEQSGEKNHSIKTLPHIDVTSVSVRNTSALFEGETIFLQVTLDNPHNASITALTVNGKHYAATSFSTTALSEITVDESFGGGAVDLTVEAVTLTLDGKSYTVACDTLCSADVFINGRIEFLGWDFVNAAHEPVYVLIPGEETYFRIKLNNPTDYTLDSVTVYGDKVLKGEDLIKIDRNTYLCPVTFVSNEEPDGAEHVGSVVMWYGDGSENNAMQVHSLSYSNEYVNSTLDQVEERYRSVYVLRSNEIRKISSVEDLYNLNEHIRYELTCDIDLAGVEWKSVPFAGMLNGNGYAIKNMSFVGTVNDVNGGVSLGLFSSAIGLIENLHIENAFTFVSTSTKEVRYGAFVARAEHLVLKNCSVDAASSVLITTSSYGYVGGIVGYCDGNTLIQNCTNIGNINLDSDNSNASVGGIAGYNAGGTVRYCTNTGNVNGNQNKNEEYVGGIVGYNDNGTVMSCTNSGEVSGNGSGGIVGKNEGGTVSHCTNSGEVSGDCSGGIVGYNYGRGAGATVSNCINSGDVNGGFNVGGIAGWNDGTVSICINTGNVSGDGGDYAGGIVGFCSASSTHLNCYATNLYKTTIGKIVTLQQLAEKSFWRDTLGWDEAIWNFDDLDPSSGKYPTLR